MRGSQRTWLLAASAFIPFGVFMFDLAQEPVYVTPAIVSLLTCGVLALATSLTIVFPRDSDDAVTDCVAWAALLMVSRAVVMQSVFATAVTVVVSGILFLLFIKAHPRVKVKEK